MHILVQMGMVSLGSIVGGLLRWGVTVTFARYFGTAFPWGTFFINISGSLFLGWFMTMLTDRLLPGGSWLSAANLRLLVAVGFTGAYTTFSTFEYDSHEAVKDGDGLKGMTYMFGSVFLGLVAVRLGIMLARIGRDVS